MITLIGTGHVFDLSSRLIEIFNEKNPDMVCVELDKRRYNALMMKISNPDGYKSAKKNLPFVYKLLARFQDNMAEEYGVTAGDEMLTAINYAKDHQIPVAFIDMDAQFLFSKMLRSMSFSEKFKLLFAGFFGFFVSKKSVEKELKRVEKNFDSYIEQIGDKFPTIKRVLIDERNVYMTQQLSNLNDEYEKVVALVGDGHVPGVSELLINKDIKLELIRLSELRSKKESPSDSSATASFTVNYDEL